MATTRRVAFLITDTPSTIDVVGPMEVFRVASKFRQASGKPAAYQLEILRWTADGKVTPGDRGVMAERSYREVRDVDTLVVTGNAHYLEALADRRLMAWLREVVRSARRVCSICIGAFILAEAGLLDGKRATTHWRYSNELAGRHPKIEIDPDPIFIKDGRFYSSAGSSAGLDLALALVEEDLGHEASLGVARELVLFLQRPGGQSQFSAQLAAHRPGRRPLSELQAWMADHPEADLSVEALARRAGMSPRNFARVFKDEIGVPPARYVELLRVESARRRLESAQATVDEVADDCGFGSRETMRKAFLRSVGVTPSEYRGRFRARG
jgi:transcriptional regulator GlxA family with amidase domain